MMVLIPPSTMGSWSGSVNNYLVQVLIIGLAIAFVAELISRPVARLQGSAWATVFTRLNRARATATRLGIQLGKGDIEKQFENLKLGLIGWLRYRRVRKILREPTPDRVLRFRSRCAYFRDRLTEFLLRCISLFRPYGIFSLANLRILLLAGAIVVVMDGRVATLKHKLLQLRNAFPWHSIAEWIREWYVLVALIIVVMIVVTRSPLVDRVRARDEAAKDANRLLAQLFGKLSDVERNARKYLDLVEEDRTRLVSNAVLKATGGHFTWAHRTGLAPASWHSRIVSVQLRGQETEMLDRTCKELSDHLAEYYSNGLHTVAFRLTRPVFWSLSSCRLSFSKPDSGDDVRRRFLVDPVAVRQRIENMAKQVTEAERSGCAEACEHLRIEVDEAARSYAAYLDAQLASAHQTLLHLHHVHHFLNKRLHGTIRTRLAGSFVR
jgi:hypothetical protein